MTEEIIPRKIKFTPGDFPRHWLRNSPLYTHFCNTFTLLFPGAESFFLRSVRPFLSDCPPEFRENIKKFMIQETNHSRVHLQLISVLKNQGYRVDEFLNFYSFLLFDVLEKILGDRMNLSLTAGFEHFTAMFAELALKGNLLENGDPDLIAVFKWHCLEELNHKSVAYDVLVQSGISYPERALGMSIALFLFSTFTGLGVFQFLFQDESIDWTENFQEFGRFMTLGGVGESILRRYLEYFNPDFHPENHDTSDLMSRTIFELKDSLIPY